MEHFFCLGALAVNHCDDDKDIDRIKKFLEGIKVYPGVSSIWFGIHESGVDDLLNGYDDCLYAENIHIVFEGDLDSLFVLLEKESQNLNFEYGEGFFDGKPDRIKLPEGSKVISLMWD